MDSICKICKEPFRDPVALPCQDNFCRKCLELYADECKNDKVSPYNDTNVEVIIPCPVCRKQTNLGRGGVARLPLNFEMVINMRPKEQANTASETVPKTAHVSSTTKRRESANCKRTSHFCDDHNLPLSIYCETCERLICTGCLRHHKNHDLISMELAFGALSAPLKEKMDDLDDLISKLEKCVGETVTLRSDVQSNQDCHLGEADKARNTGLEAVETWKRKEVNDIQERHSKWFRVCDEGTKRLQAMIKEGKTLAARTNQMLSTPKAQYIRVRGFPPSEVVFFSAMPR